MQVNPFAHWSRVLRRACLVAITAGSMGVSAQIAPALYQHCEVQEPAPDAAHRIDTNYRYPPSTSLRTFKDYWSYRCEPAFAQSPAIFDAFDACRWAVTNCSADSEGNCKDGPDDWTEYEVLRGTAMSDVFQHTSTWIPNPAISIYSGPQTVQQWGRHRWWGWSDPARYAFMGVREELLSVVPTAYPSATAWRIWLGISTVFGTLKLQRKAAYVQSDPETLSVLPIADPRSSTDSSITRAAATVAARPVSKT